MEDLVYWSHKLPKGITVTEISGGEGYGPKLWKALALQLFDEHSDSGWRPIGHFDNGVPYLENEPEVRISVTHTPGMLAIAEKACSGTEVGDHFAEETALGIDVEKADRRQVLKVRDRFMNGPEKELVDADDLVGHLLVWTAKEAVYKAMLHPGLDFRSEIKVLKLPGCQSKTKGEAVVTLKGAAGEAGSEVRFNLCSWLSDGYLLTVAYPA